MSSLRQLHPIEYKIWKGIRARCNAPSLKHTGNYQKDGIKVCERWNSFDNFYLDMGDRPNGYTIDRIDPKGDYCPKNCRWATWNTQARNRGSFNRVITYKGKTQCLKDWAKEYGIYYQTLVARIKNFPQLSFEEILQYKDPRRKLISWNNKEYTVDDICNLYGIPKVNFYDRKHKGWDLKRILTTPVIKRE